MSLVQQFSNSATSFQLYWLAFYLILCITILNNVHYCSMMLHPHISLYLRVGGSTHLLRFQISFENKIFSIITIVSFVLFCFILINTWNELHLYWTLYLLHTWSLTSMWVLLDRTEFLEWRPLLISIWEVWCRDFDFLIRTPQNTYYLIYAFFPPLALTSDSQLAQWSINRGDFLWRKCGRYFNHLQVEVNCKANEWAYVALVLLYFVLF